MNSSLIHLKTWWPCVTRKKFTFQSKITTTLSLWGWKTNNLRYLSSSWIIKKNNNAWYETQQHSSLSRTNSYSHCSSESRGTVRSRSSIARSTANAWFNATGIYSKTYLKSKPLSNDAQTSSSNSLWGKEKKRRTKRSDETWAWSLMTREQTPWCHAFFGKWTTRWAPSRHPNSTSTVAENTPKTLAKCPYTTTTVARLEKGSTRLSPIPCAPKLPLVDRCILGNRLQCRWLS